MENINENKEVWKDLTGYQKFLKVAIITIFVGLYLLTSLISMVHSIEFFALSNPDRSMAITLAIAFEIGAAASLASLVILKKMNKTLVWVLFLTLTAIQAMSNAFYAYINLSEFQGWIELFGLVDMELIAQKRILAIISGAILPLVALGFIKSLVDYIKPQEDYEEDNDNNDNNDDVDENSKDKNIEEDIITSDNNLPEFKKQPPVPEEKIKKYPKYIDSGSLDNELSTEEFVEDYVNQFEKNNLKEIDPEIQDATNDIFWDLLEKENKEDISDELMEENFTPTIKENTIPKKTITGNKISPATRKDKIPKEKTKKQNGIITKPYQETKEEIDKRSKLASGALSTDKTIEESLEELRDENGDISEDALKDVFGKEIPQAIKKYFNNIEAKKNKPLPFPEKGAIKTDPNK